MSYRRENDGMAETILMLLPLGIVFLVGFCVGAICQW